MLEKYCMVWHGKEYFMLGVDAGGTKYFIEKPTWDCGWYWGGLYIETFTNNQYPWLSRDILSHHHFDSLFMGKGKCSRDAMFEFFADTVFTDRELWTFTELCESFYIARRYSDFLHSGGAHITSNPARNIILGAAIDKPAEVEIEKLWDEEPYMIEDKKFDGADEYSRINQFVIPALWSELNKILK